MCLCKNQKIFTELFKSKPVQRSGACEEFRFEIFFPSTLIPAFKWVTTAKWSMMFLDKIITTHKSTPLCCQDQHHCTRNSELQVRSLWLQISVVLQDLMPRHPPLGSAAAQKTCWWLSILSMYTAIAALRKQGFFGSCWYAFWKV